MADDSKYPTRIAPYGLRIPPDLKDRVEAAAKANNRSMNAEIVATLEEHYPQPSLDDLIHDMVRMTKELTETYGKEGRTEMAERVQSLQVSLESLLSAPSKTAARDK